MSEQCDLCESGSGIYDFKQACCATRYIVGLPNIAKRRAELARIMAMSKKHKWDLSEDYLRGRIIDLWRVRHE